MAKNAPRGDSRRRGAVKRRSQVKSTRTGTWTKRSKTTGRFEKRKEGETPFKGVRKEE